MQLLASAASIGSARSWLIFVTALVCDNMSPICGVRQDLQSYSADPGMHRCSPCYKTVFLVGLHPGNV